MAVPDQNPIFSEERASDQVKLVTFLNGVADQETARLARGEVSWAGWLEQAARHGRFGFFNTLLISAQRPTASDVRSYRQWQQRGRQVRRSENGIRILTRKGEPRAVFDLAQTEGPAPEPVPSLSGAQGWGRLAKLAGELGLWVQWREQWVYTGPEDRKVHIDPALDHVAASVVLAHQLAHVRLHRGALDQLDGGAFECHGVRRVEADSTAHLVLAHLGLPVEGSQFPAVASWAGTDPRANPSVAVRIVGDRVLRTTAWLVKRLGRTTTAGPRPSGPRAVVSFEVPQRSTASDPKPGLAPPDELLSIQAEAHQAYLLWRERSWVPAYLTERGFGPQVQRHWGIGYAPKAWRALTDHLRHRGYSETAIVASGLARRARSGRLIDTFRDRVMLPLRRTDGVIVGFIGRARDDSPDPKYLNSPASDLFRKSELLFGLHEVRDTLAAGARPVLVEGPLDAIAVNTAAPRLYAAVAPCGTSITPAHLAALADITDLDSTGVLVALDGDEAGQSAMLRNWSVLAQVTGPLQAAVLPKAQDPADILRYQGCMAVREALSHVVSLTDLVIDKRIEQTARTLQHPEEKLAAVRAATSALALRPPSEFAGQVMRIAGRLHVPLEHVTSALIEAITAAQPSPRSLARQGFPAPPTLTRTADPPERGGAGSSSRTTRRTP